MTPPAPARLSTITCWPSASCSLPAIALPTKSVGPPGVYGITRRSGLAGYCAGAARPFPVIDEIAKASAKECNDLLNRFAAPSCDIVLSRFLESQHDAAINARHQ